MPLVQPRGGPHTTANGASDQHLGALSLLLTDLAIKHNSAEEGRQDFMDFQIFRFSVMERVVQRSCFVMVKFEEAESELF